MGFRYIKFVPTSDTSYVHVSTLTLFDGTNTPINPVVGQVVTCSGVYQNNPLNACSNLWDANDSTAWHSDTEVEHWSVVDLLSTRNDVKSYAIKSRSDAHYLRKWLIWGSNDLLQWWVIDTRTFSGSWSTVQTFQVLNEPALVKATRVKGNSLFFNPGQAGDFRLSHVYDNKGISAYDFLDGGEFKLSGYVTIEGIPASRKVFLFEWESKRIIRATWSREDGYYEFNRVRKDHNYQVLSNDFKEIHHSVSSDRVEVD